MKSFFAFFVVWLGLIASQLFFSWSAFSQNSQTTIGQIGKIDLAGVALLSVPENFVFVEGNSIKSPYLQACDSVEYLGCLVTYYERDTSYQDASFIIELVYIETGYVSDSTILKTTENYYWENIQSLNRKNNLKLKNKGCDTLQVSEWVMKPYFIQSQHQLQWAVTCLSKNKKYARYTVHKLGRHGVIEMNIRTSHEHLSAINPQIPLLASSIEFYNGFKYEDFNPNFDNLAAFGFAGILAGKVLTKAKVVPFFFKWFKWLIIVLLGIFTFFKRKIVRRELETEQNSYLE